VNMTKTADDSAEVQSSPGSEASLYG
jgi:hypothetical protein